MAHVELRNVHKSFGAVSVLQDFSISIGAGEFTVFVGPSGCGKSTLLRMIAGLEAVTRGELLIDGMRAEELEPAARGVAMVFQSCALYPHMTVERNIGFSLRMSGCPAPEVAERVLRAAEILQIKPFLKRKPFQLSGGQCQRVAIGRAIVRNPKVFLFDEPLSSLDADLRTSMRLEIAKLHRRLGATMIYVTHDQTEAMTLADRIVILRSGHIEQIGQPLQLYDRPANSFVAGFIGSPKMNFFNGTIVASPNGRKIRCLGGRFLDVASLPAALEEGTTVEVGVRPEHFERGERGNVTFPVTVEFVERLGAASYAHATTPSGEGIIVGLSHIRDVTVGTELSVSVPPERVHLFAVNGERLN
jgi:lactose/L-arabinose transport system ATP-binding protein